MVRRYHTLGALRFAHAGDLTRCSSSFIACLVRALIPIFDGRSFADPMHKAEKKGLEFNLGSQAVAGSDLAVLDDAVLVRDQQYTRVLVRLGRIDALSAF